MCYNVLCDKYCSRQLYGYSPRWSLRWDHRQRLILDEICNYNADIVCLQVCNTKIIPNATFILFVGGWNVRVFRHIQLGAKTSRLFGNIFAEIESENNAQRRFQKCWRMRNILEARQIYGKFHKLPILNKIVSINKTFSVTGRTLDRIQSIGDKKFGWGWRYFKSRYDKRQYCVSCCFQDHCSFKW